MKIAILLPVFEKSGHQQAVKASFLDLVRNLSPDHEVSLFFISNNPSAWSGREQKSWKACGVPVTFICSGNGRRYGTWHPSTSVWSQSATPSREAACAYAHLRTSHHDLVLFPDFKGLAYACLQAKRLGIAFSQTRFCCWMQGTHEWLRFEKKVFRSGVALSQIVYHDVYEQSGVAHADILWASEPSLLEWHRNAGWKLPSSVVAGEAQNVLPDILASSATAPPSPSNEAPLLSILVPHYNAGDTLGDTLASLAGQKYSNLEIRILDDGSTNPECLASFRLEAERYQHDGRFHFTEGPNRDVGKARNFLAAQARGDYFIFVDPDNICPPDMAEKLLRATVYSGCDAVSCYRYVFKNIAEIKDKKFHALAIHSGGNPALAFFANSLGDTNCCIRRAAFEDIHGFHESRGTMHHDWDILCRLALHGAKVECYPEPLFYYRLNPRGMSHNRDRFTAKQMILAHYCETLPAWNRVLLRAAFPFFYYPNQLFGIADKDITHPGHLHTLENEIKRSWSWKILCLFYKLEQRIRSFLP